MRRLVLIALVVGVAGCPAAHNDYPGGTCKTDSDCYKGEKCMNGSICVPVQSAGDDGDMAVKVPPGSDLATPIPTDAGADL